MSLSLLSTILLIVCFALVVLALFLPKARGTAILAGLSLIAYLTVGYRAGNAGILEIFILLCGVFLLFLEAAVSGFGLLGITGLGLLSFGIVSSGESLQTGFVSLLSSFGIAVALAALLFRAGYLSPLLGKSILEDRMTAEEGFLARENPKHLLGKTGIARTILRPSGMIEIEGKRYDALTSGEFIEKGASICVDRVEAGKIYVRRNLC